MDHPRQLVLNGDDIEPFTHPGEPTYHSQHILGSESAGVHDLLLNRGTVDPRSSLGGGNHPDNDEIYYGVSGTSLVDLGGQPETGEGGETFTIGPGAVVFIPAGTFHRLRNPAEEPFVLLAIWPQPAARGANGIHDQRLDEWGIGFKLRPERELASTSQSRRVINHGVDPLLP
jgi:mannose-6-phosphate isomerase-like protein (cupin superfamily)